MSFNIWGGRRKSGKVRTGSYNFFLCWPPKPDSTRTGFFSINQCEGELINNLAVLFILVVLFDRYPLSRLLVDWRDYGYQKVRLIPRPFRTTVPYPYLATIYPQFCTRSRRLGTQEREFPSSLRFPPFPLISLSLHHHHLLGRTDYRPIPNIHLSSTLLHV